MLFNNYKMEDSLDWDDNPISLVLLVTPYHVYTCIEHEVRAVFEMIDALPANECGYVELDFPVFQHWNACSDLLACNRCSNDLLSCCINLELCHYLGARDSLMTRVIARWRRLIVASYLEAPPNWSQAVMWVNLNSEWLGALLQSFNFDLSRCTRHPGSPCLPAVFLPETSRIDPHKKVLPPGANAEYRYHWYRLMQQAPALDAVNAVNIFDTVPHDTQGVGLPHVFGGIGIARDTIHRMYRCAPFLCDPTFPWCNTVIAGGSVVAAVIDAPVKDIDIFIYGSNTHDQCSILVQWLENWLQQHWIEHWWTVYRSIIQVYVVDQRYNCIQIMQTEHYSPMEVVRSFDYDYVQCWLQEGLFRSTYDCYVALQTRMVHQVRASSNRVCSRLYKTIRKGFGVSSVLVGDPAHYLRDTRDKTLRNLLATNPGDIASSIRDTVSPPHAHLTWDENAVLLRRRNTTVLERDSMPTDVVPTFRLFESQTFSVGAAMDSDIYVSDVTRGRVIKIVTLVSSSRFNTERWLYRLQHNMTGCTTLTDNFHLGSHMVEPRAPAIGVGHTGHITEPFRKYIINVFDCQRDVQDVVRLLNCRAVEPAGVNVLGAARQVRIQSNRISIRITSSTTVVCALTHRVTSVSQHWSGAELPRNWMNDRCHMQIWYKFDAVLVDRDGPDRWLLRPQYQAKKIIVWPANYYYNNKVYPGKMPPKHRSSLPSYITTTTSTNSYLGKILHQVP